MTHEARHEDPGLSLPLSGVQLIEASAGTGKTYTLATLYVRLVIEAQLAAARVLAVTFTEAATKELRKRIRERLDLAARLAGGEPPDASAEHQLTAQLVAAARAREGGVALRTRLREAAAAMDLAPVVTIHVFCRRVLADHALETGRAPGEIELIDNERALHEEVALDLWRQCNRDPATLRTLASLWPTPAALAEGLRELLNIDVLLPPPSAPLDAAQEAAAQAALVDAGREVAAAFAQHGSATKAAIDAAITAGWMHARNFARVNVERAWNRLALWAQGGGLGSPHPKADEALRISVFGSDEIAKRGKKDHRAEIARLCNVLTGAIQRWREAYAQAERVRTQARAVLVHALRAQAASRLAALKRERRQQGFDDLIRGLAEALRGEGSARLVARLRAQYAVALVDEFQDTDPEQWQIFRRVFAETAPAGLFLIGDPKQAIYRFRGGDVYTYLDARNHADQRWSLPRNFRSRPLALRAVQALFDTAGAGAFAQPGVDFASVAPGGRAADGDLLIDGRVAPGLTVLALPDGEARAPDAATARDNATVAAVATIQGLLQPDRTRLRDRAQLRALRAGDIAVLVPTHREAARMQQALRQASVPCVAATRTSLYDSHEAQELLCLIEALAHPGDDARARAALATPLLGLDARALVALDIQPEQARRWQERLLAARQRWDRAGPLAALQSLCAEHAPQLLTRPDGERALANWLQLVEAMQGADTRDPHLAAQSLRRRIAQADARNEREWPRLESDEERVQVMTLHASKGLEFPLVLMPYLSHAGGGGARQGRKFAHYHDGTARVARLKDEDASSWEAAKQREDEERHAETLRLLYVGLTRARLATFVAFGPQREAHKSALAWLLHGAKTPSKLDADAIAARLQALVARAPEAIALESKPLVRCDTPPRFESTLTPPAAIVRRTLARDWRLSSYSQLAREDAGIDSGGAEDEPEPAHLFDPTPFAGVRFGNALHLAFERTSFARWRDLPDDTPPRDEAPTLIAALRSEGYAGANELDAGSALLAGLIRHTLNARLPEGTRLCDLTDNARRAELKFHFSLRATGVPDLLALLHRHGLSSSRQGFGTWSRLEGLMTGSIDLVYTHGERYYLADYKSNRLPGYDTDALAQAMRESEYDLQYALYTLALHRWLRFRLGAGYDYERHFGGVRYLFCRGIDAAMAGSGVYAARPSRELVEALDRLFGVPA